MPQITTVTERQLEFRFLKYFSSRGLSLTVKNSSYTVQLQNRGEGEGTSHANMRSSSSQTRMHLTKTKIGVNVRLKRQPGVSTRISTPLYKWPTELVQCPGSCSLFLGTGTHSSWTKNSGLLLPHHLVSQNGKVSAKEIPKRRQPKANSIAQPEVKEGLFYRPGQSNAVSWASLFSCASSAQYIHWWFKSKWEML